MDAQRARRRLLAPRGAEPRRRPDDRHAARRLPTTRAPAAAAFVHAACAPGGARCSERGALPAPPFAAFDTGRLDARWVGDQTALVVDDKRRTLHAAWAQPITTADGHVVARAFRATAKL